MKKRWISLLALLLALCLLAGGCGKKEDPEATPPANGDADPAIVNEGDILEPPQVQDITVGTVMADAVNVRQEASSQSASLGKVNNGEMLLVRTDQESTGTVWIPVRYQGQNAYIHSDFLTQEVMQSDSSIDIGAVVNVESVLNIRAQPSAESTRIGKAKNGDKFRVLERNVGDGWTKIQYQGTDGSSTTGYVKTEFLNITQQIVEDALL